MVNRVLHTRGKESHSVVLIYIGLRRLKREQIKTKIREKRHVVKVGSKKEETDK